MPNTDRYGAALPRVRVFAVAIKDRSRNGGGGVVAIKGRSAAGRIGKVVGAAGRGHGGGVAVLLEVKCGSFAEAVWGCEAKATNDEVVGDQAAI